MPRPVILLAALSLACALAHESPDHTLEQLNEHIAEHATPTLYFQRAMAYKALGKTDLAAADLAKATKAEPDRTEWHVERIRVELLAGRPDTAVRIAASTLKQAKTRQQRAGIHFLQAQAHQAGGHARLSLHACQLAFEETPGGKIEWFLLRSENQRRLGLHGQRIRDLETGLKQYPGTVLKPHYADALIDAGKYRAALAVIERELPTLRWKSHWQIKQARALTGLKRFPEAREPLRSALREITQRLNPERPDIFLLADLARIHLISGDRAAAQSAVNELKKHHAPPWLTSPLETPASAARPPETR